MMALVGRVTLLWILASLFMLFVVLKLDGNLSEEWTWFIVFIPMWVLDVISIIYLIVFIISHYRDSQPSSRVIEFNVSKLRKLWLIGMFTVKTTFLLVLCSKLDGFIEASFVYVFLPLWFLLVMLIVDSYVATWKEGNKRGETPLRLGFSS